MYNCFRIVHPLMEMTAMYRIALVALVLAVGCQAERVSPKKSQPDTGKKYASTDKVSPFPPFRVSSETPALAKKVVPDSTSTRK